MLSAWGCWIEDWKTALLQAAPNFEKPGGRLRRERCFLPHPFQGARLPPNGRMLENEYGGPIAAIPHHAENSYC